MPVELVAKKPRKALPVHLVRKDGLDAALLSPEALAWARANGFSGEAGRTLVLPGKDGAIGGALFGAGEGALQAGSLARALPAGDWHFAEIPADPELSALALVLGGYVNTTFVFVLPGSPGACKDAWDGILKAQFDYRHMPCNFVEIMPRLDEHLRRSGK